MFASVSELILIVRFQTSVSDLTIMCNASETSMPQLNFFLVWFTTNWAVISQSDACFLNPTKNKLSSAVFFMWLFLGLDLHRLLILPLPQPPWPPLQLPYRPLILRCCCYHSSSVKFWWQFGLYQLNFDSHWLATWDYDIALLYLSHVIEFTCCGF